MKDAGVRVVNMSWGGSYKSIEAALEAKGVGKTPEERAELAKKLFAIEKDALEGAIKSAPEILFVAAAGNSNNNNAFEQFIPSGLNLPNLITVGAVDKSGKPTGFTTFGENVRLYANGFEVDSFVPGGKRMKFSGTSMAAPNVTNLAAKLFALHPAFKPADVIELLHKGGTPMEGHSELLVINGRRTVELAATR
jgi:subtilisin family serine protease